MPYPTRASADAHLIDDLFNLAIISTSIAFLIVLAMLTYFVIVGIRRSRGHYTHGTSKQAYIFTALFAIVVFIGLDVNLAYFDQKAYGVVFSRVPEPKNNLVVQVFAKQFEWNFRYAGTDEKFGTDDDIMTVNQLVVPTKTDVILKMQSLDVVHCLFLPSLRMKQDVLPGMTVSLIFQANLTTKAEKERRNDPEWVFEIACAEFCGLNHSDMKGKFLILEKDEYTTWEEEQSIAAADFVAPEVWEHWMDGNSEEKSE